MPGRYIASTVLLVPKLSEVGGSVGGQLRGDEECPFRGVTGCGRVSGESAGKRMLGVRAVPNHGSCVARGREFSAPMT